MHKLAQFFVVGLWCCVIGGGLFGSLAMAQPPTTQPPAINFKGHASFSNGVAFSPDGKRLATASADQTAKVWDAASGQELLTLKGHAGEVMCVAFSPNGKWLATASHDQTVKVWDAANGQESLTLKGHTGVITSVAFSSDGKRLASASYDKSVILWDATSGRLTRTFKGHTLAVMGVAFSADGNRLASAGSDRVLKVWDTATGQATLTLMGHSKSVTSVAFSPDGKTLATSSQDQTVKLWDATSGKEKLTLTGHSGGVSSVVFHSDGKRLLSAGGGPQPAVKEWDSASGQETGQLLGHVAVVRSVAISPDGKRFATATGHVQSLGDVKVWDVAVLSAKPILPQPSSQPAPSKPVAKDGREPIEYQPFNPALWKAKNQSTWLFPWEGERIVLLTTTADLDPKTMTAFVQKLDDVWKTCGEVTGFSPPLLRNIKDKPIFAAIPDRSLIGGSNYIAFAGIGGAEIATFYGPDGDYERFRQSPVNLPESYYNIMAEGHHSTSGACAVFSVGSRQLLLHLCRAELKHSAEEETRRRRFEWIAQAYAQSDEVIAADFTDLNQYRRFQFQDTDGSPLPEPTPIGAVLGSIVLALRNEHDGNAWTARFYQHLSACPRVFGIDKPTVHAQLLHFTIAASLASQSDPTKDFQTRWRFPFDAAMWAALKKVDWKKPGLTANDVIDALPSEHLLPSVAQMRPSFLTAERRKQNLLVGGTFEDGSGGTWKVNTWRSNKSAAVIVSDEAKEGRKSVAVRSLGLADDAMYEQAVDVKAGTRYLLSGWIKTKNVVVFEPGGQRGANFSIEGLNGEVSQSLQGTNDWRYVALVFDSRERTEVTVRARLGFHYSTATGEAWFDDLVMIPLGPSPVRPGIPPASFPAPAPGPAAKDNLLVNGSFEEGPEIPADFGYLPNLRVGSTALKGWTVTRGNIDCTTSRHWLPGHGQRSIDLHGTPGFGGVKQTFKTAVGQRYQVSFLMAGTPQRKQPIHKLAVRAADKQQEFSCDSTGKTQFAVGWERKTWDFVAVAAETTLEIHTLDTEDSNSGPILDDVSVIALNAKAPGQPLKAEAEDEPAMAVAEWKGWSKDTPLPAIAPFNAEQAKQHQEAWAKHLKVPVEYTNSIGMKFVLVPPGEFVRGSTPAEMDEARKHIGNDDRVRNENSLKSEGPQHKVVLTQPFYLGANEVRQQDYLATMGVNPAIFSQNGPQPAFRPNFDTSKMPVENVSWINAADFCARLSVKEQLKPTYSRSGFAITPLAGNGYRLPTEAEWEFACRAGTTTRVWFARDEDVSQFVWLANPAGGRPYPVGQLKPNPFGLYDIFGNVCEWAHDGWSPTAYESFGTKTAVDPVTAFVGTNERVLRGIVWPFTATGMRSSSRFNQPMTNARHFFGFRAALSVDAVKLALANPVQAEALPVVNDAKEPLTLKGHTNGATGVAFSPDGKRLVSASSDQTVRVWDAVSGREILILKGHTGTVSSVAFSPDGKRVASASIDQTVKVWDSTSGEELLALRGHTGGLLGVAFSADGKRLASSAGATEKIIKIWDATNGQVTHTLTGHSFAVHSVAFTPDGKQLVSGGDTTVKIWDVASGSELRTLKGHRGHVMGIAISPDGKWLASGCTGAMLKIWDAKSGQEIRSRFGHTQTVKSLAFSPDGKRLASASYDKTIKIWDVASGQELLTLNAHEFVVSGVSFSSDGKQLASAGGDGTVKVWDVTPRHEDDKDRKNAAQDWKGWPKDAPPPAIAPFDAAQAKQHQEAWAKHLGVPVEYTNSIGMKFRLIPPGEFSMGATSKLIESMINESVSTEYQTKLRGQTPLHKVILTQPIYLGVHEVTQGNYETVTGNKPSHFAATGAGRETVNDLETAQHPVDSVSWQDVAEFCAKLSEREKLSPFNFMSGAAARPTNAGYRLPTEAEWERACRAGTVTTFWPGDTDAELLRAGWFGPNSGKRTHAVGELKANSFGLHDTHGNVWEWVLDAYDAAYYRIIEKNPAIDPTGPHVWLPQRGLRGGSWQYTSRDCWSSFRHSEESTLRHRNVGFRVALPVTGVKASLVKPVQAEKPLEATGTRPVRVTQVTQDDPLTVSLRGHEHAVLSLAVSPDGKSLASGDLYGSVMVWNVADRKLRFELPGTAGQNITGLAFSPDGQWIATGNGKLVKVWDATNGQELKTLNGHTDQIWSVAFSSDSKRLASGSHDKSVKVWDVAKGEEVATLTGKAQSFFSVAFSPDGKWLAGSTSSGESAVMLWDTHNWKESQRLTPIDNYVRSIAFSPDNQRLVAASDDGFVKVWNLPTGEDLLTLRDRRQPRSQKPEESHAHHHVQMKSVAMSLDGKRVVSAGSNGFVTVWDAVTGQKLHSLEGHTGEVRGVAFSPDGKWVASAGNDKTVKVWTLTGRTPLPADGTILTTLVDPKKVEAGLKALEGTWQITDHVTSSKQPESPERSAAIKEQRWIFRGDVLTVIVNGEPDESVITVDPTQPLKSIDLGSLSQGDGSPTLLGLYSITGETLKLALSPIEAGRPKAMQIGEGVLGILTLTRTKPFDMKLVDSFNLPAWRQASKKLQRLKVKTRLLWRGSLRVGQLDRDFGLPKAISRWGVIELPTSTSMSPSTTASDGSIPADIWSEIAAISHVAIVTPAVTDSLLKQLSQHPGLIAIHCRGAWSATASSTAELKKSPHLVSIGLEGTSETTETLRKLMPLSNLRDLSIYNATASNELLTAIAQFKELESLSLINSGVADEHAPLLAKLTKLKMLVLQQTPVTGNDKPKLTNKGLQSLKSLKELKYFDVQGHGLTPEAEADLKASLPECVILR